MAEDGDKDVSGDVGKGADKQADKSDKEAEEHESVWQRMERPARPPRAALTHDRIAEAAVAIADAEGIDAVSMRRLAERLGVATMGLYRYVRGKDEVIELMLDAVIGREAQVEPAADWRATLRAAAWGLRAVLLRHPWIVRISTWSGPLTPHLVGRLDGLLASLDHLDLDADTRMVVVGTVSAYVNGAVSTDIGLVEQMRNEGVSEMNELRHLYASRMMWLLDSGRYPAFERYIREGVRKDESEWRFELGLECVLDGIAARLGI
ncbi:TetR/AcrR family transcriptional regulator [Microtetraspora malaysiensis]|uniref:TetR/AcrR family transcriptional regulator n=1 Tax=Microtetraspora malaysiensis TaxID=161358 RepID=UPI003D8BEDDB